MYPLFTRILWYVSSLGLVLFAGCAEDPQWHDGRHGHRRGEAQTLSCASNENAYRHCDVDGRLIKVRLRERQSVAKCDYGISWGWSSYGVWVDRGCRADFDIVVD